MMPHMRNCRVSILEPALYEIFLCEHLLQEYIYANLRQCNVWLIEVERVQFFVVWPSFLS